MSKEPREKLPNYRLKEIFALKRKIHEDPELQPLAARGTVLTGEDFDLLAQRLRDLLPPGIELRTIMDSLVHLAGEPLSKARLVEEAWRLAANVAALKKYRPVSPWQRQACEEWVPLQVIDLVNGRNYRGDAGATLTFRILAGTPAGMTTERFWTVKLGRFIGSKIGFSAPWEKYRFERLPELMNLRLYGKLLPEKSIEQPRFEQVAATPGIIEFNRSLLKARLREGFQCPKNYKHPCHACPVGYDQCLCGTHPRSYLKAYCATCHKVAWMDPQHVPLKICVTCLHKKNMERS